MKAWKHRSPVCNLCSAGEQTLGEKDSSSSRTTKSLFFSRLANFGNVSPFQVGATNTFSELIHPLIKLPNCVLKFYNLSEALGSFGLLPLRGAGTGFVGVLVATSTHFWSSTLYTTFHGEAMLMLGIFLSRLTRLTGVWGSRASRWRLLRHSLPISLLILRKKPIVLQSAGENVFLTFSRRKSYNTVKHQYYAVKSQYHLVQSPISWS